MKRTRNTAIGMWVSRKTLRHTRVVL